MVFALAAGVLPLIVTGNERIPAMFGAEIEFLSVAFQNGSRIRRIDLHPADRIGELFAGNAHHRQT